MRIRYWMTEGVELLLECADPAPYLMLLCREEIRFSDVKPLGDNRFSMYTTRREVDRAQELAANAGVLLSVSRYRGAVQFLRRFRKRAYLLLIPMVLFLGILLLSSQIWELQVSGGESLTRAQVLMALEECGVYPGVSGLFLKNIRIRGQMLQLLPELKWCTVQVHGSRAVVQIRERTAPPQMEDAAVKQEVIAEKTGLITFVSVLQGRPVVKKGDMVMAGQLLIEGNLTDLQQGTRQVHAFGEVWARTWYEKTLQMPLNCMEKLNIGEEKKLYAWKICDLRLNFYGNSGISQGNCDKMEREIRSEIFGRALPLSLIVIRQQEYSLTPTVISETEGKLLLETRLRDWLRENTDDAEVTSLRFDSKVNDGILSVTMEAECLEQIGMEVPLTESGETKESD